MLVETVQEALKAVEAEGDTAEVALRLAERIHAEGATPSAVRELRYALLALGVTDLEPYVALMAATKAAIDRSDDSLPTLAAQLRETEQTCRRLSADPVNAPLTRSVREAVDEVEVLWRDAWAEYLAGVERDWEAHRERKAVLWKTINDAGGEDVFPSEVDRAGVAWDGYWFGRRAHRRGHEGVRVAVSHPDSNSREQKF